MEFIDLKTQYQHLAPNVHERMARVLDHGRFIMGPEVAELETRLAVYVGASYAIACANGTDALQLALMALDLKPGAEIIMPAFSYFATAEVCLLLGLIPVFVDIDPRTYLIDSQQIAESITSRTGAIMPVSLFGQCVDFISINAIAAQYNLPVIEDGAQSFGARHKRQHSLSATTIGCTSFFPSKPLGCYGDGGMCFTQDEALAQKLRSLRIHGQSHTHRHDVVGVNSRLDTLQAAVLLAKMDVFEKELAERERIAAYYKAHLTHHVQTPQANPDNFCVYAQYTIATPHRDALQAHLKAQQIPAQIYYPVPMPQQLACQSLTRPAHMFPHTQWACKQALSLPMHPYLTQAHQDMVIAAVQRFMHDVNSGLIASQ